MRQVALRLSSNTTIPDDDDATMARDAFIPSVDGSSSSTYKVGRHEWSTIEVKHKKQDLVDAKNYCVMAFQADMQGKKVNRGLFEK
jgi:hypothetical protein